MKNNTGISLRHFGATRLLKNPGAKLLHSRTVPPAQSKKIITRLLLPPAQRASLRKNQNGQMRMIIIRIPNANDNHSHSRLVW